MAPPRDRRVQPREAEEQGPDEAEEVLAEFGCCFPLLDYPPAQTWTHPHYSSEGYAERQAHFRQLRQARQEEERSREVCSALGGGLPLLDRRQIALLQVMQREAADLRNAHERNMELCETGNGDLQASLPSYAPNVPAGWKGPVAGPSGQVVGDDTYFPVSALCPQDSSDTVGCLTLRATPFENAADPEYAVRGPPTSLDMPGYLRLGLEEPSFRPDPISSLNARKDTVDRFRRAVNIVVAQNRALLSLQKIQKAFGDRLPLYQQRIRREQQQGSPRTEVSRTVKPPSASSQVHSVMKALILGVDDRAAGAESRERSERAEEGGTTTLGTSLRTAPDCDSLLAELVDHAGRSEALGCRLAPEYRTPIVPVCLPPSWANALPASLTAAAGESSDAADLEPIDAETPPADDPASQQTHAVHQPGQSNQGAPLYLDKALPLTMQFLTNTGEAPDAVTSAASLGTVQFSFLFQLI